MTSVVRICEQGVTLPFVQLMRARVWAMVSPAFANRAALVLGNGSPVVVAPALTGSVRPERPCEVGFIALTVWQPLQDLVSPGSSCSQLVCWDVMRRAFESRMSIVNG